MNVAEFASEILSMDDELHRLRAEVTRLKQVERDYIELLNSDIKHGEQMMGNVLQLVMTPGVMDACRAAKEAR